MKPSAPLLLVIIACLIVFFAFSHAVSIKKFDQVTAGMTENQVQAIMGLPQEIQHDTTNSTTFFYDGFFRWCTMEIRFDKNGGVNSKFHDH
jgi:outer membrane protein assembly factor BamE (lipoprotein component of BamABCDE complex)